MPSALWVIVPSVLIVLFIVGALTYSTVSDKMEKRRRRQGEVIRQRCREQMDAVEEERKELGLPTEGSPEAEKLDYTLREMNSVVRDGYRSTDKIEQLASQLPGELEALKRVCDK